VVFGLTTLWRLVESWIGSSCRPFSPRQAPWLTRFGLSCAQIIHADHDGGVSPAVVPEECERLQHGLVLVAGAGQQGALSCPARLAGADGPSDMIRLYGEALYKADLIKGPINDMVPASAFTDLHLGGASQLGSDFLAFIADPESSVHRRDGS
jgi:hypothetical protein